MKALKDVIIIHNYVGDTPTKDNEDTIVQVNHVALMLEELGFASRTMPIKQISDLDELREFKGYVFNLVEEVEGSGRLQHLVPQVLENYGLRFSGCGSYAMEIMNSKIGTKNVLLESGLSTGGYVSKDNTKFYKDGAKYILKPVYECASIGISEEGIFVAKSLQHVLDKIAEWEDRFGFEYFADEFIEGREVSISMIHGRALPPREVHFKGFGNRHNILTYESKWDEDSYDFHNTESLEMDVEKEKELVSALNAACRDVWATIKMSGYARIDFRVDANGKPFVMEINSNPCIAVHCSLALSCASAGISQREKVEMLIDEAEFVIGNV
ncbi:MAG: ATP-grasp domain-containing protein [Firmicutes bacterium]|nr:ATP-grasp domain-containing protein [Bacillota bacterium]